MLTKFNHLISHPRTPGVLSWISTFSGGLESLPLSSHKRFPSIVGKSPNLSTIYIYLYVCLPLRWLQFRFRFLSPDFCLSSCWFYIHHIPNPTPHEKKNLIVHGSIPIYIPLKSREKSLLLILKSHGCSHLLLVKSPVSTTEKKNNEISRFHPDAHVGIPLHSTETPSVFAGSCTHRAHGTRQKGAWSLREPLREAKKQLGQSQWELRFQGEKCGLNQQNCGWNQDKSDWTQPKMWIFSP